MAEAGEMETSKKQSDTPSNFVTLVQLRERWLKKKAEEEEERKRKELQDEVERRRKLKDAKERDNLEVIQRNFETSIDRRENRRTSSNVVVVASAEVVAEDDEDDEATKPKKEKRWKGKRKLKEGARAREKEKVMEGEQPVAPVGMRKESESIPIRDRRASKGDRMEFRPKIEDTQKETTGKEAEIENRRVPSGKYRGKREVNMKFPRKIGNVEEDEGKLEMEGKLGELSIEEENSGLETKMYEDVSDDGRSHGEGGQDRHVVEVECGDEKRFIGPEARRKFDGNCGGGYGGLNRSQSRRGEPQGRSYGRFHGRGGRGQGGCARRGRRDGGRHGGNYNVGVWVRKEDVGSGGEVIVNSSKDASGVLKMDG